MIDMDKAISATLGVEGGWSDHPADPGGKTKYGITEKTLRRAARGGMIVPARVRDLTVDQARMIYREMYWKQCGADRLRSGINAIVFDICVNSGPRRAVRILQKSVNTLGRKLTVDGRFGKQTRGAAYLVDPFDLLNEISAQRHVFWSRLVTWRTFRMGWTRRGYAVHSHAVLMLYLDSQQPEKGD